MSGASGTWVEIVASTAKKYQAIGLLPSASDAAMSAVTCTYDVGVGSAGHEIALGSQRVEYLSTEQCSMSPTNPLFACNIPAGSRLAVRHTITANPSKYDVCLIGVPA